MSSTRQLPTQRAPHWQGLPPQVGSVGVQGWPRPLLACSNTPAGDILKDAVFYIDAKEHQNYGSNPKNIRNLGTMRSAGDARCGSTSVADSNDPKFLDYQGAPYVYLPGVILNYLSTPDAAALDITGDIDLRAQIALDSWTPSAFSAVVSKMDTSTPSRSYELGVDTDGTLRFHWSADGSTGIAKNSTVATGLQAGEKKWIRVTLTVNNGSAQNEVRFYTSPDGTTWTQLGTTVTTAGTTSIFSGTSQVDFGSYGFGSSPCTGKLYRAQIYNGIAGTLVFDADTSVITSGSATTFVEKSSNAATVTINRSTNNSRRSVAVVAPCWLLGVDDFIDTQDHPALNFSGQDSFTVFTVFRVWNTLQSYGNVISKRSSSVFTGWALQSENTNITPLFYVSDSLTFCFPYGTTYGSNGGLSAWSGIRDRASKRIRVMREANTYLPSLALGDIKDTVAGSLANTKPVRIGAYSDGVSNFNFELMAVAIFRRALSTTEITALNTYFQSKWP